jgi:hypothetical protein
VVGTQGAVAMEQDHSKGKVEILKYDSQVWNPFATFCLGGIKD